MKTPLLTLALLFSIGIRANAQTSTQVICANVLVADNAACKAAAIGYWGAGYANIPAAVLYLANCTTIANQRNSDCLHHLRIANWPTFPTAGGYNPNPTGPNGSYTVPNPGQGGPGPNQPGTGQYFTGIYIGSVPDGNVQMGDYFAVEF